MKRGAISAACALSVGLAFATPSDSALAKSAPGVAAIVADVEQREKGDNDKIADALMSLEGEAETAAEKYLFRREAVLRYLKTARCDKAKEILLKYADENDAASALAMDEYANRRLSFKEKRALKERREYKEYETLVREMASVEKEVAVREKRLKDLEAAFEKSPENVHNRNLLAMEYAVRGEWAKAIPLLVKAKGVIGESARAETSRPDATGTEAVAIADGWWNVVGKNYAQVLTDACRRHAVDWYRTALADEGLPNLVKLRVGGRVEEIESKTGSSQDVRGSDKTASSPTGDLALPTFKVTGGETVKMVLDGKGKVTMELATCEPGVFKMGDGTGFHDRTHQVSLTYPYLIGKGHLTFGMVKAVDRKSWKMRMDGIRTDEEKFYGDDMAFGGIADGDLAAFLMKLNALASKCRELRAYKGYEFRLPTEAEWVRAYQAGTDEEMEGISDEELKKYWGKVGNPNWKMGVPEQDVVNVLKKKPNAWGISNMVRGKEDLADTIPLPKRKNGNRAYYIPEADRDCFGYADFEENPIRICTDKTACHIARKGKNHKEARAVMNLKHPKGECLDGEAPGCAIRLVYGPKLSALNVCPEKANTGK